MHKLKYNPKHRDVLARLHVHLHAHTHECTHTGTRDWELESVVREPGVEANYEGGMGVGGGGVVWVEVAHALQEGRDRVRTVSTCMSGASTHTCICTYAFITHTHTHTHLLHIHMHICIYYTYSYIYA